jgi:phenol 2-monooxygenase (NADPH)
VIVTLENAKTQEEEKVRAKYVVGCDGARSRVRDAIGAVPRGDFANHAWGVVDMLADTDFPDIRLKAAIQSADEGNILLIPREGGYMVRLSARSTQRTAKRSGSSGRNKSSRPRNACSARTRSTCGA